MRQRLRPSSWLALLSGAVRPIAHIAGAVGDDMVRNFIHQFERSEA